MSVVTRIPSEVAAQAKVVANLRNSTPAEVIAAAWAEYLENHREEIAKGAEQVAQMVRDDDLEALVAFANRDAEKYAEQALKDRVEVGLTNL